MWPFKNKIENKEDDIKENTGSIKRFKLAPGESADIGLYVSWRADKDEALIITEDGQIIVDKNTEIFVEIDGDNIGTTKFQIVPDFKNRTMNIVEVINFDDKKKFTDKCVQIFGHSRITNEGHMSFSDYIKSLDQDVKGLEKMERNARRLRNILTPVNVIAFIMNSYNLMTGDNIYINIFAMIISICVGYFMWYSHKRVHSEYIKHKEYKDNIFGIVKRE